MHFKILEIHFLEEISEKVWQNFRNPDRNRIYCIILKPDIRLVPSVQ